MDDKPPKKLLGLRFRKAARLDKARRVRLDKQLKADQYFERIHRAWTLRTEGKDYGQIAQALECSIGTVAAYLRNAIASYRGSMIEDMEFHRALENERMDKLLQLWWPVAMSESITLLKANGEGEAMPQEDYDRSLRAAQFILEIAKHRARVNGLVFTPEIKEVHNHNDYRILIQNMVEKHESLTIESELPAPEIDSL
jgi:hypothetical protein